MYWVLFLLQILFLHLSFWEKSLLWKWLELHVFNVCWIPFQILVEGELLFGVLDCFVLLLLLFWFLMNDLFGCPDFLFVGLMLEGKEWNIHCYFSFAGVSSSSLLYFHQITTLFFWFWLFPVKSMIVFRRLVVWPWQLFLKYWWCRVMEFLEIVRLGIGVHGK